jgi:hypothetical protein
VVFRLGKHSRRCKLAVVVNLAVTILKQMFGLPCVRAKLLQVTISLAEQVLVEPISLSKAQHIYRTSHLIRFQQVAEIVLGCLTE